MNWKKVAYNTLIVAISCATLHHVTGETNFTTLALDIAMCLLANFGGLLQNPPHKD